MPLSPCKPVTGVDLRPGSEAGAGFSAMTDQVGGGALRMANK